MKRPVCADEVLAGLPPSSGGLEGTPAWTSQRLCRTAGQQSEKGQILPATRPFCRTGQAGKTGAVPWRVQSVFQFESSALVCPAGPGVLIPLVSVPGNLFVSDLLCWHEYVSQGPETGRQRSLN